jgi:hypothetical protein
MDSEAKLLAVYTVIEKHDGKDIWLRVGSGFHNRDGSLSLLLDAVPINGRLQVRDYRPRDQPPARRAGAERTPGPHEKSEASA